MATYIYDTNTTVYDKMDPDVKAKWVAALRSGEYLQASGWLKILYKRGKKFHHCCLGVAAEVLGASKNEWHPAKPDSSDNEDVREVWVCGDSLGALTYDFMDSIKLDTLAASALVDMNDNGTSFKRIATWIEKNL